MRKFVRNSVVSAFLVAAVFAPYRGYAQTFSVLHAFTPRQSAETGGVILDSAGNLYGTTVYGGQTGNGTIFKLSPTGRETILYQFGAGPDGSGPESLIRGLDGNFYGTTDFGGTFGYGTVFKFGAGGEQVLYNFTGGSDGAYPQVPALAQDAAGNLYGTTRLGAGTVFKLDSAGGFTTLYTFAGGSDGYDPEGGVIVDAAGNLYGDTISGGSHSVGTVYKLSPGGVETILHNFTAFSDGLGPYSPLLRDAHGNLYGTTYMGGTPGCGTIFKVNQLGAESVLHSFTGPDGCEPFTGVVQDSHGNLYGTTDSGGDSGGTGPGVVFMLAPDLTETVVYDFSSSDSDGAAEPSGELLRDPVGNLYGTTLIGGGSSCDCGVVYKITP